MQAKPATILAALLAAWTAMAAGPAGGPLRVLQSNPRYFTDGSGKAVLLSGSHTWTSFQDGGWRPQPQPFDYPSYLQFLLAHHHNFIRLWTPETAANLNDDGTWCQVFPVPYPRTGPGSALDGQPRFDLSRFDPRYFERLRARVREAGKQGIYVSVMLFDVWGVSGYNNLGAWKGHPYNGANNINHINGDPKRDGNGLELHTLHVPAITALQEAYVRKVVDTVNDLDNVLYEISNESPPSSKEWQYHLIRTIHAYEQGKPKQHPVGMTATGPENNDDLFNSPAEWVSPVWKGVGDALYPIPPPAPDGKKVILVDTDHLWNEYGDPQWVWRTFLRGYHPIYMDRLPALTGYATGDTPDSERSRVAVRKALGHAQTMAQRMNLGAMTPQPKLASTGYCLAAPGTEYLIYQPKGGEDFSVELKAGTYRYEWFDPGKGGCAGSGRVHASEGGKQFKAPFAGDAVLSLKVQPE